MQTPLSPWSDCSWALTTDPCCAEFPEPIPGSEHPPVDRPAVATAAAMVLEKTWLFSWFWSLHWGAGFYRLIAGQGGRVPFEWLLHAGYQAFLCATHDKTRITSLQVYVCGPLLELVDSLETNLVTTRRV